MPIKTLLASCCAAALAIGAPAVRAAPASGYIQTHSVSLGGPARWDYVMFDPSGERVFVAHGDHADVVDVGSLHVAGRLSPLDGAHGTAVAPGLGRIFADSSGTHSLTAFDATTLKPVATVAAGEDADAVAYDAATRRVFVINGDSGTISVVDAATLHPVATMQIGGKLEFAAGDGHGTLFLNLAGAGAIARIDAGRAVVTARWPVAGCVSPHGLAYDVGTARLFTSCENGKLDVLDAADGRVVASLPIGKGSDTVALDPRRRLVFSSNYTGTMSIIRIRDAGHFEEQTPIKTPLGARTMAVDPATGALFLASATATGKHGKRYSFKPDSLKLLVYAPQ